MGALTRIGDFLRKAVEGSYRPGPYYLPVTGGWLPDGAPINWWQTGYDPVPATTQSAMVEACVSAYAQTIAMCPGNHWRTKPNGGRERVTNSALTRILKTPNEYQSISDYLMNSVRELYIDGNSYSLCLRNNRFEIEELHLMTSRQCSPHLTEDGEIFYRLAGNDVIASRTDGPIMVPARDVLHVRLNANRKTPYPLIGESPVIAAMMEMAVTDSMARQQVNYYMNGARPSAVLSTDLALTREKVEELRQLWNEQAKGLGGCGPGGVPILTHGMKVQPWSQGGKDSAIADVMKLSDEKIALAFRIPLAILGLGSTPFSSTEVLFQSWLASGLGFALNHMEEAIGNAFGLFGQPEEYLEFDTAALLRSAFKDRIDALARGVQGGILSPNEARNFENLPNVKAGEEPRVQQQLVPLSFATGMSIPPAPGPGAPPSALAAKPSDELPPPKDAEKNVRRPIVYKIANDLDRQLRRADYA